MATYSREYLLTYSQNKAIIDLCKQIEQTVLQKAMRGETSIAYLMNKTCLVGNGITITSDDVVKRLQLTFPDSIVEFQEIKNIHGKVESGIVIDWS
jgi:hypothetical protein